MSKIINGKLLAEKIIIGIKNKIEINVNKGIRKPGIAILIVGNNEASKLYVSNKIIKAKIAGFYSCVFYLKMQTQTNELLSLIQKLNQDVKIDGILVQLPLPDHIDKNLILKSIYYKKDVDGFHPINMGKLIQQNPFLRPCTPKGIMHLLHSVEKNFSNKNSVIVGASNIVGRPMAMELLLVNSTVTICHKFTKNLSWHLKHADIVIVAIGHPNFIKGKWLKKDSIVIDVGINKIENGKIVGDVDFEEAINIVSYITPVPGGVGPMTIAMLLKNTFLSYNNFIDK